MHTAKRIAPGTTSQTGSLVSPDGRQPGGGERALIALVAAARSGDERAWERLHSRFTPMLRSIAHSYRLSSSDVDDAVQMTWVRLVSHIGRVREPAALAGWLATTIRRECLRLLQRPIREHVTDDPQLGECIDLVFDPERALLAAERRMLLARALDTLPERHRRLMVLLLTQPKMDYETVSTTLGMPRGSIGPIRARSIARLQGDSQLRSVSLSAAC